jgi:hypothetical protein
MEEIIEKAIYSHLMWKLGENESELSENRREKNELAFVCLLWKKESGVKIVIISFEREKSDYRV